MKSNAAENLELVENVATDVSIGQIYKKVGSLFSREIVICEVYVNKKKPHVLAYDRRRQYVVKIHMEKSGDKCIMGGDFHRVK